MNYKHFNASNIINITLYNLILSLHGQKPQLNLNLTFNILCFYLIRV